MSPLRELLEHAKVPVRGEEWPLVQEAYQRVALSIEKLRGRLGPDDHPAVSMPPRRVDP